LERRNRGIGCCSRLVQAVRPFNAVFGRLAIALALNAARIDQFPSELRSRDRNLKDLEILSI